jgi:hypothetical protein
MEQESSKTSPAEETSTQEQGTDEARRLINLAQARSVTLRVLGGIAIALRCRHASHRALAREYADIDFMGYRRQAHAATAVLSAAGYTPDRRFNALHGERRLLFFDEMRGRQVDIFLDVFEMCHTLHLEKRLTLHPLTLSPADLLLTKLQIVEMNAKDVQDILVLILDYPPINQSLHPGQELDLSWIASVCGKDWGWFTTVNDNLGTILTAAPQYLDGEGVATCAMHIQQIKAALDHEPKSLAWRTRAVAGRHFPWYELPEEVRR